jgi:hypothetical protein
MKITQRRFININQHIESMSEVRKSLLLMACVWFIFMMASGGRMPLTALLINQNRFFALFTLLLGSAMDAVLIVELLRSAFPMTRVWGDIKHFSIIAIVWMILIPLSVHILLLITQPKPGRSSSALPDSSQNTSIYFIAQSHSSYFSHAYFI